MLPHLIVVSGPSGAGKTSLAHALARRIGCPAICRDEIKEGMTFSHPGYRPAEGDPLNLQTYKAFFEVLEVLLRAEVTVVAEAAFQGHRWHPHLDRLGAFASIRVVRCVVDSGVAQARMIARDSGDPVRLRSHTAPTPMATEWQPITMGLPTLEVDTADGYDPGMDAIVAFSRPESF